MNTYDSLSTEAIRQRIAELEDELSSLKSTLRERCVNEHQHKEQEEQQAAIATCKELVASGRPMEAAKHYRSKFGCGLREAHDAVTRLA